MTREEIYKELNTLSQKVNDINKKLDAYINDAHGQSTAYIDYLSAMTGIDIPTEDEGVFTDAQ